MPLANGRNNSQQCCVCLQGPKKLSGFKLCATTRNRVGKRTQHVTSNNVGSCRPTMLRPFARGLTGRDTVNLVNHVRDMSP